MNPRAVIGALLVALGGAVWYFTPSNVTWGNHHYVHHIVGYVLMGIGAVFLLAGSRERL
jgi:hypothetical protein